MDRGPELKDPRGRILVVDDDPGLRALFVDFLEQQRFESRVAPDGPSALAALDTDRFDLIFVDFHMPGMSGLELAAVVRRTDPVIPIILVTGEVHGLEAEAVARAGISRVLPKPFPLHELITCLRDIPGS